MGAAAISPPRPMDLLAWYDRHRRKLPWRAPPGERADPYRVWLSEIMLQQTTVKAVGPYYARFLARWPDIRALAAAPLDDVLKTWAGLGYYARARNLHACARVVVEQHDGQIPASEDGLRDLPGIGAYTAAAIAAIAFDAAATPVDGNIERVIARLYAIDTPLPAAKPEISRLARGLTPPRRAGDFAQAMMDLGATICTPKTPACALCPWNESCAAYARGDAETFPRRVPKREGALRRGAAFVARRADGFVLLRTRPEKGLLGGMTEVPTTEWTKDFDESVALKSAPRFASRKVAEVAAHRRRCSPRLHPFPARAHRLRGRRAGAHARAQRDAVDCNFGACRRGSAEPHAQGLGTRTDFGSNTQSPTGKGSIMTIERHEAGPRMSKAVVHGDTVYLAGIVADAPKGKTTAEQTKSILSQIDGFLAKAGTDKSKLLSANIWITDMANFAEMNAVWDAWVSPGHTPARATVEAGLASPDYKVEIMVVAAR